MKIYIDAMGGDHAPGEIVKGTIEAVREFDVDVTLVGKSDLITQELLKNDFDDPRITILNADSVIGFDEEPVKAIRHKKDSSIVTALRDMKGQDDAVLISAGSTGALLAGATLILGRIPGVARPGLGVTIPQENKNVFLIDVGASADYKPDNLLTYAKLARVYLEALEGIENPTVGLINVGTEAQKGSKGYKETYTLLADADVNFKGNAEPKDLFTTPFDILVCDGFTGNIIIKTIEGVTSFMFSGIKRTLMETLKGKIGALLVKDDLKKFKDDYDPDEIGGLPFLGVKGGIIKAHGSSKAHAFKNAVRQGILLAENNVVSKMKRILEQNDE